MENTVEKLNDLYKVPNLEKGILILEVLANSNRAMTLNEVRAETDVSQTTAYRILQTLIRHGYVGHDEISKKFRLTRKMLTVGFRAIQEQNLLEVVVPRMRELRDILKETVCFGVMGEEKGLFIEQVLGTHTFCFVLTPGKLFDLHCSAPGKAMMAFMPSSTRSFYLSKMEYKIFNANTIPDEKTYLKELETIRREGYAVDREEELHGVVCIGAPVFNYSNTPCGAIWISGPKDRLPEKTIDEFSVPILTIAKSISFELGYTAGV
jgi:DNA-binding IclR family transcriptional regulator